MSVENKPSCTRKLLALSFGVFITFLQSFINSEFGPFFTTAAEEHKRMNKTQIGTIFTSAELSSVLVSLFLTPKFTTNTLKKALTTAALVNSVSSASFGFLFWIDNSSFFFVGSVVLRVLLGAPFSCYWVSLLALASSWYPLHRSIIAGVNESMMSLGFSLGPSLGNLLVLHCGYDALFLVPGIFMTLTTCFAWFVILEYQENRTNNEFPLEDKAIGSELEKGDSPTQTSMKIILKWEILIASFSLFVLGSSFGFVSVFLTPFLTQNLNSAHQTPAIFFALIGVIPMFVSPITGLIVDKHLKTLPRIGAPVLGILGTAAFILSTYVDYSSRLNVFALTGTVLISVAFSSCVITSLSDIPAAVKRLSSCANFLLCRLPTSSLSASGLALLRPPLFTCHYY